MPIANEQVTAHAFLAALYEDDCFPDRVVDRGRAVLLALCERIEAHRPDDLAALYALTHAATEEFNELEAEFEAAGSEIETVAREETGEEFWFVAQAYGFADADADAEELIAPATGEPGHRPRRRLRPGRARGRPGRSAGTARVSSGTPASRSTCSTGA